MNKKIISSILIYLIVNYFIFLTPFYKKGSVLAQEKISGSSAKLLTEDVKLNYPDVNFNQNIIYILSLKKKVIKTVLERYHSPLVSESDSFINVCFKYQIDCYLLPSIAGVESTFGLYVPYHSFNPFGWGNGQIKFFNWENAIETVAREIKLKYIDQGLNNLESIGKVYAPPSKTWVNTVDFFMKEFYNEEFKINKLNLYFYD